MDELLVKRINSGKYFAVENGNSKEVARKAESSSSRRFAFQSGTFQSIESSSIDLPPPQNRRLKEDTSRAPRSMLPPTKSLYNLSSLLDESTSSAYESLQSSNMEDGNGEDNGTDHDHLLLVKSMPGHTSASKRFYNLPRPGNTT